MTRADFASLVDVALDLTEQIVEPGEFSGWPKSLENFEFDRLTVKIALEINQMGLDLADLFAERRVRADVAGGGDRRRMTVDPGQDSVDAIGGNHSIDLVEIRCRHADPGPSTRPVRDESANPVRMAQ